MRAKVKKGSTAEGRGYRIAPLGRPNQINDRVGAHLLHHASAMDFDGFLPYPQFRGDLFIRLAGDDTA
jgi:hypothetical protein